MRREAISSVHDRGRRSPVLDRDHDDSICFSIVDIVVDMEDEHPSPHSEQRSQLGPNVLEAPSDLGEVLQRLEHTAETPSGVRGQRVAEDQWVQLPQGGAR